MKAFNLMEVMLAQILSIFIFGLTLLYCRYFWIYYHRQHAQNRFIQDQILLADWLAVQVRRATDVQFTEESISFIFPDQSREILSLSPEVAVLNQPFFDEPVQISVRQTPDQVFLDLKRNDWEDSIAISFPRPKSNWQSKAWYAEY